MSPIGLFLVAFLAFAGALLVAGYVVWSLPQQRAAQMLAMRLR